MSSCKVVGKVSVIERRSMGGIFDLSNWLPSLSDISEYESCITCNNSFPQSCFAEAITWRRDATNCTVVG